MLEIKPILIPVIFLCASFLSGCKTIQSSNIEEIHIEGVTWACNISTSYAVFGSAAISEDQPEVYITACEGDLLYMLFDEMEFYYRFSKADGQHLVVNYDTSGIASVYLNGRLNFIELSGEQTGLELFSGLPEPSVKQISTLLIREDLSDDQLQAMKKHETSLHGIGLILEHEVNAKYLQELLSICRPKWMVINDKTDLSGPEQGKFLADLELLWMDGDNSASSSILNCCSNLESLIITDWNPAESNLLPLAKLKRLHSLTIADCGLRDLSGIGFPPSLRRMQLVMCDTLSDISQLSSSPMLNRLILSGCDDVENPEVISELQALKWLSFPSNINQAVFNTILDNQPSLEVVEILQCSQINDLSTLENHSNLKYLIIDMEEGFLLELEKLNHLKLLVLSSEIFEKYPELISELRTTLPETKIVPGSGICLGSGWMLLLLPVIFLSYILFRKE